MDFNSCLAVIIRIETGDDPNGGYTNDPRDPGGETKWGIAKRAHPTVNIANLTLADAAVIYKQEYWDPLTADMLTSPINFFSFDTAVNQGVTVAQKFLSQTKDPGEFMQARLRRYSTNPNWAVYGKGWTSRLIQIMAIALADK